MLTFNTFPIFDSEMKTILTHCVNQRVCDRKLPYVCKLENKTPGQLFYKNSLAGYRQDGKMSYIMNAFLAVVHGLDQAQKNVKL